MAHCELYIRVERSTPVHLVESNVHSTLLCSFQWPPPFGHWLFSFFPLLAPAVFKFYDGLSQFTCPPSYIMRSKEAREKFPQLNDRDIKYCAVFYKGSTMMLVQTWLLQ